MTWGFLVTGSWSRLYAGMSGRLSGARGEWRSRPAAFGVHQAGSRVCSPALARPQIAVHDNPIERNHSSDQMLGTAVFWTSPWLPPRFEQNF